MVWAEWINVYGLAIMVGIMVPNVVYAMRGGTGRADVWKNRVVEAVEQVGRYGCFGLMVVVIPGCGFGFSSDAAFAAYLVVNGVLLVAYWAVWALWAARWNHAGRFGAVALSVIPSLMFLASGVLSGYVPLVIAALVFAPSHITISWKNAG